MSVKAETGLSTDHLILLGAPRLRIAGDDHPLTWGRPAALLAYLAIQPGWHSQEHVSGLFYPDALQQEADPPLQRLLRQVASLYPALGGVERDESRLRWTGSSDFAQFELAVDRGQWAQALEYTPEAFLQGFAPLGIEEIDLFIAAQRLRIGQRLGVALASAIKEQAAAPQRTLWIERLAHLEWLDDYTLQVLEQQAHTPRERAAAIEARAWLERRSRPGDPAIARPSTPTEPAASGAAAPLVADAGSGAAPGTGELAQFVGDDPVASALAASLLQHIPELALFAELQATPVEENAALSPGLLRLAHALWRRLDSHERAVVHHAVKLGAVPTQQLLAAAGTDLLCCRGLHRMRWLQLEGDAVQPASWAETFVRRVVPAHPV